MADPVVIHYMPPNGAWKLCQAFAKGESVSLSYNPELVTCKKCLSDLKDQVKTRIDLLWPIP